MLDSGNTIILVNCQMTNILNVTKNYIPVKMACYPSVLTNRSVLCNCEIEAEIFFILQSLTTYPESPTKLIMNFIVNLAFVNYFDNWNTSSENYLSAKYWTTHKKHYPSL